MSYSSFEQRGPAIALAKCFYCLEGGDLLIQSQNILFKNPKIERMNGKVIHMQPCSKCKGFMQQGIILITIDDAKSCPDWNKDPNKGRCPECDGRKTDPKSWGKCKHCDGSGRSHFIPNPWRTGGWFVVTEESFRRMFSGDAADFGLKMRWMFIEHAAAEQAESERMNKGKESKP